MAQVGMEMVKVATYAMNETRMITESATNSRQTDNNKPYESE